MSVGGVINGVNSLLSEELPTYFSYEDCSLENRGEMFLTICPAEIQLRDNILHDNNYSKVCRIVLDIKLFGGQAEGVESLLNVWENKIAWKLLVSDINVCSIKTRDIGFNPKLRKFTLHSVVEIEGICSYLEIEEVEDIDGDV